jgi:hypothetical protein
MFLWNDKDMRGRLRGDVFKGEDVLILVNFFAGNLAANDSAKQATAGWIWRSWIHTGEDTTQTIALSAVAWH